MRMLALSLSLFLLGAVASGQSGPYAIDALLAKYAEFSDRVVVPFVTIGEAKIDDEWKRGSSRCGATLIYADEQFVYGTTAAHCYESSSTFRPERSTLGGEQAELSTWAEFEEVRLVRAKNTSGQRGVLVHIATHWDRAMRIFTTCILGHRHGWFPQYRQGTISSRPEHGEALGPISGRPLGDIVFDAGVIWGCSGSGIFVYNERAGRFELAGVVNGFSLFSNFSYAYSVPVKTMDALKDSRNWAASEEPRGAADTKIFFRNWEDFDDSRVKDLWLEHRNSEYELALVGGEWCVGVGRHCFIIGPSLEVTFAVIEGSLDINGIVGEQDWRRFDLLKYVER